MSVGEFGDTADNPLYVIFFFSLTTYLLDIVLILLGEILSKSPLGVKRLTTNFKIYNALKVLKIVLRKKKRKANTSCFN